MQKIFYTLSMTPVGALYILFDSNGILETCLAKEKAKVINHYKHTSIHKASNLLPALQDILHGVDSADARNFLFYHTKKLSPFHVKVLKATYAIAKGHIATYSDIAKTIGNPKAVRAVGSAEAHNPIPYFIPCHRVIRKNGKIGNYGMGGTKNKQKLLKEETGKDYSSI